MYKREIEYSSIKEFLPAEVGINGVNLKDDSNQYNGNVIDVSGYKDISIIIYNRWTGTQPTVGKIDLYLYQFLDAPGGVAGFINTSVDPVETLAGSENSFTLFSDLPLGAIGDGGGITVIAFNTETGTLAVYNKAGVIGATIAADCKILKAMSKIKFALAAWTPSDAGTTHTGSMVVRASA